MGSSLKTPRFRRAGVGQARGRRPPIVVEIAVDARLGLGRGVGVTTRQRPRKILPVQQIGQVPPVKVVGPALPAHAMVGRIARLLVAAMARRRPTITLDTTAVTPEQVARLRIVRAVVPAVTRRHEEGPDHVEVKETSTPYVVDPPGLRAP